MSRNDASAVDAAVDARSRPRRSASLASTTASPIPRVASQRVTSMPLKVVRDEHELEELERPPQREGNRRRPEPPEPRRNGRDTDERRVELRVVGRQREGDEHPGRRQDNGERVAGELTSLRVAARGDDACRAS